MPRHKYDALPIQIEPVPLPDHGPVVRVLQPVRCRYGHVHDDGHQLGCEVGPFNWLEMDRFEPPKAASGTANQNRG